MFHCHRNLGWLAVAGILAGLTACGSKQKPPVATGSPTTAAAATTDRADQVIPKSKGNVSISENIRRACGISEDDAYFAFDSASVDARARGVLSKVAECFRSGPLRGKKLNLIGHADPRGDSEYNMVLGGQRASSVESVLLDRGLPRERISTTSRGEMDATGTDEQGWVNDRRVDLTLGT